MSRAAAPKPGAAPADEAKPDDQATAPSVFYEESDRSAFGDVGDLSALDDSFPRGVLTDAVPQAIEPEALRLAVDGEVQHVHWNRVRALAVAGVRGLSEKPVVVVDFLVDGGGTERPLRVVNSPRWQTRSPATSAKR